MALDVCHIVRFPSRQSKICQNAFSIAKKLANDGKRFGRKAGIINRQRSELKPTVQINQHGRRNVKRIPINWTFDETKPEYQT